MRQARSVEDSLKRAQAMLDEMEDLLLSREVFWPLDASAATRSDQFPKLSIGAFLLTTDQLASQANEMSPEQINTFQALGEAYAQVSSKWPANLGKKAVAEMRQRANLWRAYLQELADNPSMAENYAQEVKNRVLLERLQEPAQGAEGLQEVRDRIQDLDSLLRSRFQPGNFIWDPRLLGSYSDDRYWFLAGHPKQ